MRPWSLHRRIVHGIRPPERIARAAGRAFRSLTPDRNRRLPVMNAAGNPLAVADINDRRRLGRMLAVLLVAPFLAQADVTIVNVATPAIHIGLGASGAALELVVGGDLVAF